MFSIGKLKKISLLSRPLFIKPICIRGAKDGDCKPPKEVKDDCKQSGKKDACKSREKNVTCEVITGSKGSGGDGAEMARPVRLVEPGKVRMGFIPEEWFQMFYPKTGVTGPYMFGFGVLTILASKEFYVMEHEYYNGISLAIMAIALVKGIGPVLAKWADKEILGYEDHWQQNYEEEIRSLEMAIAKEKKEQWRAEGALHLVELKRENIEMQLEASYREALNNFYKQVVQCLEYQVECHHVEQRVQKKHMIQWVAKHVVAGLPQMSKEAEIKAKGDMSAMCLQIR